MSEKAFVKKLQKLFGDMGCLTIKLRGDGYQLAGLPDILVLAPNSRTLFVEAKVCKRAQVKNPAQLLTARQRAMCSRLADFCPVVLALKTSVEEKFLLYPSLIAIRREKLESLLRRSNDE